MASSSQRLVNASVTKPIIIGTYAIAVRTGNETSAPASSSAPSLFRWTMLIRSGSSDDEDLSEYIRRVEFNLHSTFAQPKRIVECPPFQVEEQGWGEFEIHARIFFQDTNEKPLDVKHWLKLRPDEGDLEAAKIDYSKQPLVYEQYDEIVFNSPHEWFYEKLTKPATRSTLLPPGVVGEFKLSQHPMRQWFKPIEQWKQEEKETEEKLIEVEKFLRTQIANHQSQILLVDSDYRAYRDHFYKYNISG